jgi:hypothetical protein
MPQDQQDPVAKVLRMAPAHDAVRAEAWDAFQSSKNADELAARLKTLKLPDSVKADLWDLKQSAKPAAQPAHPERSLVDRVGDTLEGVAKNAEDFVGGAYRTGLGGTLWNAGRAASMVVGQDIGPKPEILEPRNQAERVGQAVEQTAEFMSPAGWVGKGAKVAQALKGAALTGLQGGSSGDAATTAALTVAIPGAGTVKKTAEWVGSNAAPLVRAAIKPTVSAMSKISGASTEGLNAKAEQLVRWIIENRVTTADKARTIFAEAERELQRILAVKNAPTDAATRAARYLGALEKHAAKQGLGADDVAAFKSAAAELIEGPMGHNVTTMVPKASAVLGANGQPMTTMVPQTSRALRPSVPAAEALESARVSGQMRTGKQWGELKSSSIEARKGVERAQRDAVKKAVPESRDLLKREGMAIQAEKVLDRAELRSANRDAVSLPAHVIAAGEIASGRVPVMAFAANWLRNNQLKAGIYADKLEKAIKANKVPEVVDILKRLGVAGVSQAMKEPAMAGSH